MQKNQPPSLPVSLSVALLLTLLYSSANLAVASDGDALNIDKVESSACKKQLEQANSLFRKNNFTAALPVFSKLPGSPEDDGTCRIMVGYCYYNLKKYKQALQQYQLAAQSAKLISVRKQGNDLATRLSKYMSGICPGNCLKPSMAGWCKKSVPGTPDRLVWMVYPYLDQAGKGGSEYWSNDHMGEVIEYVNGRPMNKGRCPICLGTGKVALP